jgi:glycosyltransferase involved in cell wall biosynthesis
LSASISISIPAYNEQETIEPLIRESLLVLAKRTDDYEVVVINDGSTDRTRTIVDALSRENPRVKVFHHERNMGFGATLKDVFQKPTKEIVFFIPGDAQIAPGEMDKLLPALDSADLILGWRRDRQDAGFRKLLSGTYNLLISLFLRARVHDVDTVVVFKRSLINAIHFSADSAFVHAELLLETHRKGFRWIEQVISHRERQSGSSTIFKLKVILPVFRDIFRYIVRRLFFQ